jgi:predicted transcriptional regulator YheO
VTRARRPGSKPANSESPNSLDGVSTADRDADDYLEFLSSTVQPLAAILGTRCEVVLHDLRRPDASIVAIANGDVTGRSVGDPSSSLVLPVLRDPYGHHDRFNYRSYAPSGRPLKSSTVHFKDSSGRIFAALCVNWDLTWLASAQSALDELIRTDEDLDESRFTDVGKLIDAALDEVLSEFADPARLTKNDRIKVISLLRDHGIFEIRRAVDSIALRMGISRATVYADLRELDASNNHPRTM